MKIATNANRSSFFMHANYFEQRQPKKKMGSFEAKEKVKHF